MVNKRLFSGFALVETAASLVVVAGIYTGLQEQQLNKQQVNHAIELSRGSQQAIVDFYHKNKVLPENTSQIVIPSADKLKSSLISDINVNEFGDLIITFTGKLNNKTIILEPTVSNGEIIWNCNNGTLDNKYRPSYCYNMSNSSINQPASPKQVDKILKFVNDEDLL